MIRFTLVILLAMETFSFTPANLGADLWAWGWAGDNGANVTLNGNSRITRMNDLSGNGHDFIGLAGNLPGYQSGIVIDSPTYHYETTLPLIGLDRFSGGSQIYGNVFTQDSSLNAAGPFYLAAACMNSRRGGIRELFGTDSQNYVQIDQQRNDVFICINGSAQKISLSGGCPVGPLLLEVWRDAAGKIWCYGNGQDISAASASNSGLFALNGTGYDGTGSSQWDDYAFEYVMCDGLPSPTLRDSVREYLRAKWGLYGSGSSAMTVAPAQPCLTLSASPNPFTRRITISTGLPVSGLVSIFDMSGRLVTRFNPSDGNGRCEWNASDLANGRYIIRLEAGAGTRMRTITRLK